VEIKQPLVVTSGFRCAKHQADLREDPSLTVVAKKQSSHERGDAADIRPKDRNMKGFEAIAAKHFDAIGLADTFLHVDLRQEGKIRWKY
jgi:uncharacterized protein YcbK (DUF882 family)